MKKNILLLSLISLISFHIAAKVLIITHSYNRPDFIELHAKTFNAFLQDEYEYVVFNDAPQEPMKNQIDNMCKKLGIRCFRIPQNIHNAARKNSPGHRHMDGIDFAFKTIGYDHDGIVMLIDSDMFLLKPFSIEQHLNGHDIVGDREGRTNNRITVDHFSPALAFMNMQTLPNKRTLSFEGGYIHGLACDVGAHTYYYLKDNPSVKYFFTNHIHIATWKNTIKCKSCNNMSCEDCLQKLINKNFDPHLIEFIQTCPDDIEFFVNHAFLHYRSGSNWNHKPAEYVKAKTTALNNLMNYILS